MKRVRQKRLNVLLHERHKNEQPPHSVDDARNRREQIQRAVRRVFDLRPAAIVDELDLLRPIYAKTAAYGHFGREDADFPWEATNRVDALRDAIAAERDGK